MLKKAKANAKAVVQRVGSNYHSYNVKKKTDNYVAKRGDAKKYPGYWWSTGRTNKARKDLEGAVKKSMKFNSKMSK